MKHAGDSPPVSKYFPSKYDKVRLLKFRKMIN